MYTHTSRCRIQVESLPHHHQGTLKFSWCVLFVGFLVVVEKKRIHNNQKETRREGFSLSIGRPLKETQTHRETDDPREWKDGLY